MDPPFWLERWQQSQIGFHQSDTNASLKQHWQTLGAASGAAVLVPLCGKSLDMVWLASIGHKVIGIELSQIAIDEFYDELGVTPDTRTEGGFTIKSTGPYELWCGDLFAMPTSATDAIGAIYDRASLVALPPAMRQRYATKLAELNQRRAPTLLITLEYDQSVVAGPPHSVPVDEVHTLFGESADVHMISRQETDEVSPKLRDHGLKTIIEAIYQLAPRGDSIPSMHPATAAPS